MTLRFKPLKRVMPLEATPTLATVTDRLVDLRPDLESKGVVAAAVYGSVARADATVDSDVDLALMYAESSDRVTREEEVGQLMAECFGRQVDITELPLRHPLDKVVGDELKIAFQRQGAIIPPPPPMAERLTISQSRRAEASRLAADALKMLDGDQSEFTDELRDSACLGYVIHIAKQVGFSDDGVSPALASRFHHVHHRMFNEMIPLDEFKAGSELMKSLPDMIRELHRELNDDLDGTRVAPRQIEPSNAS